MADSGPCSQLARTGATHSWRRDANLFCKFWAIVGNTDVSTRMADPILLHRDIGDAIGSQAQTLSTADIPGTSPSKEQWRA